MNLYNDLTTNDFLLAVFVLYSGKLQECPRLPVILSQLPSRTLCPIRCSQRLSSRRAFFLSVISSASAITSVISHLPPAISCIIDRCHKDFFVEQNHGTKAMKNTWPTLHLSNNIFSINEHLTEILSIRNSY